MFESADWLAEMKIFSVLARGSIFISMSKCNDLDRTSGRGNLRHIKKSQSNVYL